MERNMSSKHLPFIAAGIAFMGAMGCSKSTTPSAEVPSPSPVSQRGDGELCSEKEPCAESFDCAQTHAAFCQGDAECATGEQCDLEIKTCTAMRCVNACGKVTKRYRYSDRKLLHMTSATPPLKDWIWGSECSGKGLCDLLGENCTATRDSCTQSLGCTWFGECIERDGTCIAEGPSCQAARVCTENGRCTAVDQKCTATREEDCQASRNCTLLNWCGVQEKYGLCRLKSGDKPGGTASFHGTKKLEKDEELNIKPIEGGLSVAAVFAQRKTLKDTRIQVRGKVMKYTPGILQRNFIHLQDGSGSEEDKTHDLTVTTQEETELGKIITVEGTVIADRDFGSGYFYPVILEESKVIATD